MKTPFLAVSILAATSLSHAGFTPIDDTQLGDVTGQAGVSIEPTIRAEIGSIVYTDEGSIGINDIVFGGANKSSYFGNRNLGSGVHSGNALDGVILIVNVRDSGDLRITGAPTGEFGGLVDFKLVTGNIDLISADNLTTTTLVDSINVIGVFTGFTATVRAATSHTDIEITLGLDDIDIDLTSSLGIKVENAFIVDSTYFEALDRVDGFKEDVQIEHLTAGFEIELYADNDGLHVELDQAEFDMGIGAIIIADASIGSFRMNNVNLGGLSMVISGHP